MMHDRIGVIHADGTRVWPEHTLSGQTYTRPAHTRDIGYGAFIVYDPFPPADTAALMAAAIAFVTPKQPKRKPRDEHESEGADESAPGL